MTFPNACSDDLWSWDCHSCMCLLPVDFAGSVLVIMTEFGGLGTGKVSIYCHSLQAGGFTIGSSRECCSVLVMTIKSNSMWFRKKKTLLLWPIFILHEKQTPNRIFRCRTCLMCRVIVLYKTWLSRFNFSSDANAWEQISSLIRLHISMQIFVAENPVAQHSRQLWFLNVFYMALCRLGKCSL